MPARGPLARGLAVNVASVLAIHFWRRSSPAHLSSPLLHGHPHLPISATAAMTPTPLSPRQSSRPPRPVATLTRPSADPPPAPAAHLLHVVVVAPPCRGVHLSSHLSRRASITGRFLGNGRHRAGLPRRIAVVVVSPSSVPAVPSAAACCRRCFLSSQLSCVVTASVH